MATYVVGQVDHMEGKGKKHFSLHCQCGTYSAGDPIMSFSLVYGGVLTLAKESAQLPERMCQQDGDAVSSWRENSKKYSCTVFLCEKYMARVDEKTPCF